VLFQLWNSWSQRLFHTLSDVTHTDVAVFAAYAERRAQSVERGGQHTGCTGYWLHTVVRLNTITHNSTYYTASSKSHRADTALGVSQCGTPHHKAQKQGCTSDKWNIKCQVEHQHQELNSPCGTVILQFEQWAHLARPPLLEMLNVLTLTLLSSMYRMCSYAHKHYIHTLQPYIHTHTRTYKTQKVSSRASTKSTVEKKT
jgi:hypothetical protein